MELSVVVPMYNEEKNVEYTVREITETLKNFGSDWELLCVNDGSTDKTLDKLKSLQKIYPHLKVASYFPNYGHGKALREGFKNAEGKYIISIDADLSYSPDHILKIYETLIQNPQYDVVLGSAYMKGGNAVDVPFFRLLISKFGNHILRFFVGNNLKTVTCVLRGYKKEVLNSVVLEADDKNIHLEIIAKVLVLGYKILEIPATLKWRKFGQSKFKLKKTVLSHLLFSFYQSPIVMFMTVGAFLMAVSAGILLFLIMKTSSSELHNFWRMLGIMSIPFLFFTGIILLMQGALTTIVLNSRIEVFKIHRTLLNYIQSKQNAEKNIR